VGKLFISTNEGAIRMLDNQTGAEDWMFIPTDMLGIQARLRDNPNTTSTRLYGIDGVPVLMVDDLNGDGTIDPGAGDKAYLFVGMRRGGKNIYALDITPTTRPANGNVTVNPKLMWIIKDGAGDFASLGQTWSTPKVATVYYNSQPKRVLMFGGGYDAATQDTTNTLATSNIGNAVYMVDPLTGQRLWWASNAASTANLKLTGMDYPIPSDLRVIDSDGDSVSDRVYVGDTGGQVWRIDLPYDLTKSVGGKLASIASTGADADKRRFFYPPEVVFMEDYDSSLDPMYDMVLIGSGYRAHPLDKTLHDQFYAFRDRAVDGLKDANNDGNADTDTAALLDESGVSRNNRFFTLTQSYLYDATDNVLQENQKNSTVYLSAQAQLKKSLGWYVNLKEPGSPGQYIGEKVLASAIVAAGRVYFTTYLPDYVTYTNVCASATEGRGRVYVVSINAGEAVEDLHPQAPSQTGNADNPQGLTSVDRWGDLGEGIPASVQTVFTPFGVVPILRRTVGATLELPRQPTYWSQE
jgi:type IV pilus assembly protein PilY1